MKTSYEIPRLGLSTDPLFNTWELPEPPKGCVWMEWVGEASPLDSPTVAYNLATGKYTRDQEYVIRKLAQTRVARVHRHRRRIRKYDGVGPLPTVIDMEYVWGPNENAAPGTPGSFCQAVPFKTADAIKSSDIGHQFVIHGERDGETRPMIRLPKGEIIVSDSDEFTNLADFRRAMGW